jgi:hypothetical protein
MNTNIPTAPAKPVGDGRKLVPAPVQTTIKHWLPAVETDGNEYLAIVKYPLFAV